MNFITYLKNKKHMGEITYVTEDQKIKVANSSKCSGQSETKIMLHESIALLSATIFHILSIFVQGWLDTFIASFFGLIGHQEPSSWNLISSTSEQSLRISIKSL